MIKFVGIDGCRSGWYAVTANDDCSSIVGREYKRFSEILDAHPAAIVAIDIPIGLLEKGTRGCDQQARHFLRPNRTASLFTAPLRCVLNATTHAEASALRKQTEGKGMSIQAFAITAKVLEVDQALQSTANAGRVHEVHPEVSFARLNSDAPMKFSKKTSQGRNARISLLEQEFPGVANVLLENRKKRDVARDDVLDALIALWTAKRIAKRTAIAFESVPLYDSVGQRMTIFS